MTVRGAIPVVPAVHLWRFDLKHVLLPCLIAAFAVSGCATKKYVGREVGEVNQKVDTLSTEVEKTQERVKRNEVRIDDVDREAKSGIADAKGSAEKALVRATEAERAAKGKLIYTVTLSNDKVTFPVNRALVSPDARQRSEERRVGKECHVVCRSRWSPYH